MQLDIATGFYQSASLPLSAQRCINWEPQIPEVEALSQRALFDPYGIATKALTGATIIGINRGGQAVNGVPYFINEGALYSFDLAGFVTNHGFIDGEGRVSLANNGQFLVIVVPGVTAYVFDNVDSSLTEITDIDFQISDTVSFKDGFFIFTASDGEQFFNSNLNQPLVYSALDIGTAEVRPDKIIASHVNHNELFIPGEDTIELFETIGGSGFPFQRVPGGNIQKGVHAKFSVINFANSWVFLGGEVNELTAVWRLERGVQKISTSAIDNAIQKYTKAEIADAFAFTYAYGGSNFLAFTFTSTTIPSKTFVYDATASALSGEDVWHERQSGVVDDKWRVTSIISAFGELLVGDSIDGRIGILTRDLPTEYGGTVFRQKTSMPFQNDQFPLFASDIKLRMESGVGTIAGLDPQIKMEFSDNGGRSYKIAGLRSYGKIGDYDQIPAWRRQGLIPRDRLLRFTTTEPVKSNLLRLDVTASQAVQL